MLQSVSERGWCDMDFTACCADQWVGLLTKKGLGLTIVTATWRAQFHCRDRNWSIPTAEDALRSTDGGLRFEAK